MLSNLQSFSWQILVQRWRHAARRWRHSSKTRTPDWSARDVGGKNLNPALKYTPGVSRKDASEFRRAPGHQLDSGIYSLYRVQFHTPQPLPKLFPPPVQTTSPQDHTHLANVCSSFKTYHVSFLCESAPKWRPAPLSSGEASDRERMKWSDADKAQAATPGT